MLLNLRARVADDNGNATIYTWRAVEQPNEETAHATARAWGEAADKAIAQTSIKSITTSIPSKEDLDKEDYDCLMDEAQAGLL